MNLHAVCHTVCWLDVCCAWRCSIHSIKILPVCADQVDAKLDGATDVWRVHLAVENCFCHFPDAFVLELFLCIVGMLSTGDSWHIVARIWANQEALEAHTFFWFSTSWVGILFTYGCKTGPKKSPSSFAKLEKKSGCYVRIYGLVFRVPTPPNGMGRQVAPPSLLCASYWQHFWGPASYLLGLCSKSDYQPHIY